MNGKTCRNCNNSIKRPDGSIVCGLTGKKIFDADNGEEDIETCMAYNK